MENLNPAQYRIIEDNVQIGENTKVRNFTHIRSGTKIGKNCNIGWYVHIGRDVIIWNNVKIQNSVNIFKWVEIEDDVFIWPAVTFTNDLYPRAFAWGSEKIMKTLVKKGASIGANATIKPWIVIGEYSLIGAWTMVVEDVPPYAIVVGNPWKIIGWVDKNWNKVDKPPIE